MITPYTSQKTIIFSFHNLNPNLHLPLEPLILFSPKSPWLMPAYSISYQLSSPCSRKHPPSIRNAAPVSDLSTLPHSDITAWTDGLVPGGLRVGGARIYIKCTKCLTAASLSFSAGCWATSYSAETYVILYAFKWFISYSSSCAFESVTLFSDSQSVLATHSVSLPYLILKSFTDTQFFLNSLSDSKIVRLKWMSCHSFLPGNY